MKRKLLLLTCLLALSCNGRTTCKTADYSACGSPLPATDSDGKPWPTFSEALAAEACSDDGSFQILLRGMCADGKQFITNNGGFVGVTRYFRGEHLVGTTSYTDVGGEPCQCPFERFQGTLETVRCDAPRFEALCGGLGAPEPFQSSFSQGTAWCVCDDPSYQ